MPFVDIRGKLLCAGNKFPGNLPETGKLNVKGSGLSQLGSGSSGYSEVVFE